MNKIMSVLILMMFANAVNAQDILLLKQNGKVIIGDTTQMTTPGNYNLYVQHGMLTEKVKVSVRNTAEWSDDAWEYVPRLAVVAESIKQKRHLVNMPSAASLVKDGYELKSMDAKLLEQIEWIWLHVIALEKENNALKKEVADLKKNSKH
jgi:trimeric autotransporter adhesin